MMMENSFFFFYMSYGIDLIQSAIENSCLNVYGEINKRNLTQSVITACYRCLYDHFWFKNNNVNQSTVIYGIY